VSASLDLAAPRNGSSARLRKLSSALAARGARDPGTLAAYIAARRGGQNLANPDLGIYLSETVKDSQGQTLTCPECGHIAPSGAFGTSGAALQSKPGLLRTPAPGTAGVRKGVPLTVRGGAAHALASTRTAVELATGTVRRPIHGPMDVLVKRGQDGTAELRHRQGGATIASLRRTPEGKWLATVGGRDLQPRDHQRTALMEAVGQWNGSIRGAVRPKEAPLQPEPQQSSLMAEYGIPAMRSAAFATPTAGVADGPKVTTASASTGDSDGDNDAGSGLSPKAQAIYKKLLAKGFPTARAMAFAKNSEKFGK
jgi:hypothetical protein